jgi:hypothetical protein
LSWHRYAKNGYKLLWVDKSGVEKVKNTKVRSAKIRTIKVKNSKGKDLNDCKGL